MEYKCRRGSGGGGARGHVPSTRPSKVSPVTPQSLCSIGRYSGCAPLDPPPLFSLWPPPPDHPFWIRLWSEHLELTWRAGVGVGVGLNVSLLQQEQRCLIWELYWASWRYPQFFGSACIWYNHQYDYFRRLSEVHGCWRPLRPCHGLWPWKDGSLSLSGSFTLSRHLRPSSGREHTMIQLIQSGDDDYSMKPG